MMLSNKTLFFALIFVALSSFTAVNAGSSAVQVPRFMLEDGNLTDSHDDHDEDHEGDCHCDGDEVHCDDPDEEADCHCHDGEAHCDHDDNTHSGASSFSLIGSAFAGAFVAAAL
jgi:hypothetical protein